MKTFAILLTLTSVALSARGLTQASGSYNGTTTAPTQSIHHISSLAHNNSSGSHSGPSHPHTAPPSHGLSNHSSPPANNDNSNDKKGNDACKIHAGCSAEDGNFPFYNGEKWTCSDDMDGTTNNGFDACEIHYGCMQPDAWPQYDMNAQKWVCCDVSNDGCLQQYNPKQ